MVVLLRRASFLRPTGWTAATATTSTVVLSPFLRGSHGWRTGGTVGQFDAVRAASRVGLKADVAPSRRVIEELRERPKAGIALVERGVLATHRVLHDACKWPLDALAL